MDGQNATSKPGPAASTASRSSPATPRSASSSSSTRRAGSSSRGAGSRAASTRPPAGRAPIEIELVPNGDGTTLRFGIAGCRASRPRSRTRTAGTTTSSGWSWPPAATTRAGPVARRAHVAGLGVGALPHPQRDEPGDQRDEEDLAEQRLEHGQRLREPDRGREVAEAERGQRDEAEVEVLGLLVRAGLGEERARRGARARRGRGTRTAGRRGRTRRARPSTVSCVIRRWRRTRLIVTGSVAVTSRPPAADRPARAARSS